MSQPSLTLTRRIVWLPCDALRPNPQQPRVVFDAGELESLADSIRQNGLLQPLSVKRADGGYRLIAGERRLRAARLAGLDRVPCVVVETADENLAALALVENVQRSPLNFFEEAEGIEAVMRQRGISQAEAARLLGRAQPTVANKLRLLALTPAERGVILDNGLTERHARALLALTPEQRSVALCRIIARGLNVAQTEALVARMPAEASARPKRKGAIRDLRLFTNSLNGALKTLRCCGLEPRMSRRETEEWVEYVIRVPVAR